MSKVTISGDTLVHDGVVLGPAAGVYTAPGEAAGLLGVEAHLSGRAPHNIDILFAAGEKVVGCEVKTVQDLVDSWRSRRLQRQLRTLQATVDVSVLVIRETLFLNTGAESDRFWEDWVHLQTRGVYILPVPPDSYWFEVGQLRHALSKNSARIFAGTDQRPPREQRPGWLLRRVPGIGPVKSLALLGEFGSTSEVFTAAMSGNVHKKFGQSLEDKLCRAMTE